MKFSSSPTLAVVALIGTVAQVQAQQAVRPEKDIPTTAIDNGSFTTLVAALGAADLVGPLSDPNGPFTVFAPTDEAFDALPNGLVECLLLDDNKDALSAILTYHVVSGQVLSTDLMDGMVVPTFLDEQNVIVDISNIGVIKINDSTVVAADVLATNGVIHVIDEVLVPPSIDVTAFLETCATATALVDIPSTAVGAGIFNTLVAALDAVDLVDALTAPNGPYTVFAPTDDAFDALPSGLVTCLLKENNNDVLSAILTYHVVSGQVLSTQLMNGMVVPTYLDGQNVIVEINRSVGSDDDIKINNSNVILADVAASNGVIHVIDAVLVPPSIDVIAFLESSSCDDDTNTGGGVGNNNDVCTYLGESRLVGQYLIGPTHTCLCTSGGHWIDCQTNNNNDTDDDDADDDMVSLVDIPSTAIAAGAFNTLVAALSAADLVGALSEPNGPFTVFAPTDDAFAALPDGLVTCLLEPDNKGALTSILTYHVVSGQVLSTDLEDGMTATTLQGEDVTVDLSDGVKINDSKVISADVMTSNGVIHVIDAVLVPPSIDVAAFLETCSETTPVVVVVPVDNNSLIDDTNDIVTLAESTSSLSSASSSYLIGSITTTTFIIAAGVAVAVAANTASLL